MYEIQPNQLALTNGIKRNNTAGAKKTNNPRCILLKLPFPSAGSGAFAIEGCQKKADQAGKRKERKVKPKLFKSKYKWNTCFF